MREAGVSKVTLYWVNVSVLSIRLLFRKLGYFRLGLAYEK